MLIIQGGREGGLFLDTFERVFPFPRDFGFGPTGVPPDQMQTEAEFPWPPPMRTFSFLSYPSSLPSTPLFQLSRNS